MINDILSLNGPWYADFLADTPYTEKVEPIICSASDSAVVLAVPGYWEDMEEQFCSTRLYEKLKKNPLYVDQSYPQTGYCSDLFLPNPVGCLVYEKRFVLEEIGENPCLHIGGAQNTVSAWINGTYLGRHEGYCTPFSFEIQKDVLRIGENRITLAVSNNRLGGYMGRPVSGLTSRAANECTGGIYGDVELRFHPDDLRDVWVTVAEDCRSITVHTEGAGNISKAVSVWQGDVCICTAQIAAGEQAVVLNADGLAKWSADTPNLYQVKVSTAHQEKVSSFGVRRLTAKGTRLYLNGEPYYFRGICEHCYQYATVHPTNDKAYYIGVIQKLKTLGFNSIRFHTWIPPYAYMEAADELGMLLEVETPNNTSIEEWEHIIRFCRHYTSVNLYSTGNELQIDKDYEKHLRACADLVHTQTDALFSPMSAMRGIEYMLTEEDPRVVEPFEHNPQRLARIGEFCDVYNSYSVGLTSYDSSFGTQEVLDKQNAIYGKPLLSHEICIQGTYIDLSLEERYDQTRIGQTQFMSSVRTHLENQGLLEKAELYYENSVKWQSLLRKHCFETVRRCHTFAGYDFLGDIDTHWHTFGYCVGMMNEFYELKAGETAENVLRYNSPTVLLADLPKVNFFAGEQAQIPILVSHYGADVDSAKLRMQISSGEEIVVEKEIEVDAIENGDLKELYLLKFAIPELEKPVMLKMKVQLWAEGLERENCWDIYGFPNVNAAEEPSDDNIVICNGCTLDTLEENMRKGRTVVIFGTEPFVSNEVTFQMSIAGRTTGHLATVVDRHPIVDQFPQEGFCAKQFEYMLNGGKAVVLDGMSGIHKPIIDIATSYKNAHKEALLFECGVEEGKMLVCPLNLRPDDPAAQWLKQRILTYVRGEEFAPSVTLTSSQLRSICAADCMHREADGNRAVNRNDITA